NAGAQTVAGWATAISAGPPDEAGQMLSFDVSNNNNALFAAQPSIDATGKLTYTSAPDVFGTATVTVQLHDNGGTANGGVDASAAQTFTLTVSPINHAPTFTKGAGQTVLEDAGAQAVSGWATNVSAGPSNEAAQALDFIVTNDNNALFSSQPAVDATGKLSYTPAPNRNGSATVTVKLHDNGGTANGGVDTSPAQTFTITVTPVNDAPTFNLIAGNTAAEDAGPQAINGALTNASPGPFETGQTLTLTVTNDNNALFSMQPSIDLGTGTLKYTSAPNANGSATVTVKLQDDGGTANGGVDQTTKTFTITVTPVDDAPVITIFYGPVQPIALGGSISVTGTFTDVDLGDVPPDSHTGTIDWGDGSSSSLTIAPGSGTSRDFSGSHKYAAPGVYTIVAHINDAGGLSVDATCKSSVVVFDSNGGFVTGGGWINSPPGASANVGGAASAGKAAFGLVEKYQKGQSTPDGNTEFQAPGLDFKSTSCDWLVTSGPRAQYQGSGTINGSGDYAFMVTVIDGSLTAKHGSDMFRIKIWDKSSGLVIYDNQPGTPDSANPTSATGGGSIRIHN
ncbi:MAG TPA: Ig-like domain-containing protein, partial [Gemmatimonadaceae bacterium]